MNGRGEAVVGALCALYCLAALLYEIWALLTIRS